MVVKIPARNPRVIAPATAMTRLGSLATGKDSLVSDLVGDATDALATFLGFFPCRQTYETSIQGWGDVRLQLPSPHVDGSTVVVTRDGEELTGWSLDSRSGILYRADGWPSTAAQYGSAVDLLPGSEVPELAVTFAAGFVVEEDIKAWAANLVVTVGDFVRPPWPARYLHEVTVAGTMAATAPTWATTAGTSITSGTATLVARASEEVPKSIKSACLDEVTYRLHTGTRDSSLASRQVPGLAVTWRSPESASYAAVCATAAGRAQPYVFLGAA